MSSVACASLGARRTWDDDLAGVSDGVPVRPSRHTEGAARTLATRFPPGRWRRWRLVMGNAREAHRRELSE